MVFEWSGDLLAFPTAERQLRCWSRSAGSPASSIRAPKGRADAPCRAEGAPGIAGLAGARMRARIYLAEGLGRDVGVDLGGGYRGVAE